MVRSVVNVISLSPEDQAALAELLKERRAAKRNTSIVTLPDGDGFQTPEIYIARTTGIPALSRVGTGSGSGSGTGTGLTEEGDIPGYAECEIYNIINDVSSSGTGTGYSVVPRLEPVVTDNRTVFNLSRTEVGEGWILVVKTKFGHWVASTSFGSSSNIGTGSGLALCSKLPGVVLADLPIVSLPAYVLGVNHLGCIVLVPVGECA